MSRSPFEPDWEFVPVDNTISKHLRVQFEDGNKLKEFIIDRLRELHPVYISLGAVKFIIDFKEFKNARIDVFENGWINNIAEHCIGYEKCEIRWEELKNDYMKYEMTVFKSRG